MKTNLELYWGVMDGNRWLQETPRRERSFFVTNRQTLYHNIYIITITTVITVINIVMVITTTTILTCISSARAGMPPRRKIG